ncbi:SDR family NAD(P)-dependent oxidoreductase [Rhodococcus sp. B50]|uniref:SDR family NAD(P)-dependent oxidoreductase n=1 Tax=Rhodococcus sp. B50 TaxID=2682847 RepID=UPI001BD54D9C|nr:SDR family NAD(P)-dependent oxidoreductase [Rhodococcus sp. B50]MBS9376440.1 Oxidoreductase UcpA [Rhodococcus sp. B50]
MGLLTGKVALVTGSAQGLGAGCATAFTQHGARVACVDLNRDGLERAAAELVAGGAEAIALPCDVANREQVDAAVAATVQKFGRLDILVNAAMTQRLVRFDRSTEADLLDAYRSSVLGTYNFMMASFPHLKENGGKVINFGSASGTGGEAGMATYAAAKEAVRGLSKAVAVEWGRFEIAVNVICPIGTSPAHEQWAASIGPEAVAEVLKPFPIKRMGDPVHDIGGVAVFLASSLSDYMTGRTLFADGGRGSFR